MKEYLNKEIARGILNTNPDCQCKGCTRKATGLYKIVSKEKMTVADLIPVCAPCHTFILVAAKDRYLPQREVGKFSRDAIREMAVGIRDDEKYAIYSRWLRAKHTLKKDLQKQIIGLGLLKRVSGIKKHPVTAEELPDEKFTGREIEELGRIVKTAENRRENKENKKEERKFGPTRKRRY